MCLKMCFCLFRVKGLRNTCFWYVIRQSLGLLSLLGLFEAISSSFGFDENFWLVIFFVGKSCFSEKSLFSCWLCGWHQHRPWSLYEHMHHNGKVTMFGGQTFWDTKEHRDCYYISLQYPGVLQFCWISAKMATALWRTCILKTTFRYGI